MFEDKTYTINSLKYDGKIHRTWKAEVIEQTNDLIVFKGVFEHEIQHSHLGVIRPGTISYEYYWKSRWFNVFRFHEPEGGLRNYYCNVNCPPVLKNNQLNYIDLDVDVLVWKDFSFEILDLDEFKENSERFDYSKDLRVKVDEGLGEILELIKNKRFPFDYKS